MYVRESPSTDSIDVEGLLWVFALLFFGLADVATTGVGIASAGVMEFSPTVGPFLDQYGMGAMVLLKVLVFVGAYAFWRVAPRPERVGVPLGLTMLGVFVTGWNLSVLVFTSMG